MERILAEFHLRENCVIFMLPEYAYFSAESVAMIQCSSVI